MATRTDHVAYQKAWLASVGGLALQIASAVVMVIYGSYTDDHAAMTSAYFMFAGAIVWGMLVLVFDQHKRERIEAMEQAALEASGAGAGGGSSVFAEAGDELLVAARRLSWMHKVLVPIASVMLALVLVLIGLGRLGMWPFGTGGRIAEMLSVDSTINDVPMSTSHGLAISVGLAIAVVNFVYARYVSGMAKQKVWGAIRAGAGQSVGAAIFGGLVAVSHFALEMNSDTVYRYVQVILPMVLIVLSIEVVLNFVLGVYRPRKPGEFARPAFDSNILGYVSAPDRIAATIGSTARRPRSSR